MRTLSALFLASYILLAVTSVNSVSAQSDTKDQETSQSSDTPQEVNTYDLFWPIVAGKTKGDTFYFLKRIKENLKGAATFGETKKANYQVFLAVKRGVEAEKLINEKDTKNALESLRNANSNVQKSNLLLNKAIEKDSQAALSEESYYRLKNLQKLALDLSDETDGEVKNELETLNKNITDFIDNKE